MAKILIVDDDASARELVVTVLGYGGHDVQQAVDGSEALERVHHIQPQLIIADLLMPTMDGFEFVRRLRHQPEFTSTPVVFYTATYLETEVKDMARACGVSRFISKPAEPQQIIDVVGEILGSPVTSLPVAPIEEFHREHVGLLTAKLAQKAAESVPRLGAMINLSLQLASERDPKRLLENFCSAARKIVGSLYATVGVLETDRRSWRHFFVSGMDVDRAAAISIEVPELAPWNALLNHRTARRIATIIEDPRGLGLPAGHPPVQSLLAVPVASPERVYGWLCLANKVGAASFSDEDEGLAQILAAQMGRIYENGSLYSEVKRHADTLEREILERVRVEQALRASEQSYRTLVEGAQDAIFTLNVDREITSLNATFETITGWSTADWIGRPVAPLLHPDDTARALQRFSQAAEGGKPSPFELRIATRSGQHALLEFKVTPLLRDGRCLGVLGIGRDVRERKNLEEQVRQAQKMESIGRLAGGIAHDFNNLLTVINGCTELMILGAGTGAGSGSTADSALLNDIHTAGERAAALTRQLLAFSRQSSALPVALNVNTVVTNLEKMLRRLIGEDIELSTLLDPELGHTMADPVQVEQVIMNLVVNARDAMPQGGKLRLITGNLELGDARDEMYASVGPGSFVCLAVVDSGTGISPEVKARLFEPFFTTKESGRGTGLGLATVYGIVKQSRGHIVVTSEVGRGARFEVLFPRLQQGGTSAAAGGTESRVPTGHETLLLVEDDEAIRRLVRLLLESLGYTVHTAANGPAALRLTAEPGFQYDLVLTDVIMPNMSGPELVEKLRAAKPGIPVLFMSGHAGDALRRQGIPENREAILQKPFTLPILARRVREKLNQRAA